MPKRTYEKGVVLEQNGEHRGGEAESGRMDKSHLRRTRQGNFRFEMSDSKNKKNKIKAKPSVRRLAVADVLADVDALVGERRPEGCVGRGQSDCENRNCIRKREKMDASHFE